MWQRVLEYRRLMYYLITILSLRVVVSDLYCPSHITILFYVTAERMPVVRVFCVQVCRIKAMCAERNL